LDRVYINVPRKPGEVKAPRCINQRRATMDGAKPLIQSKTFWGALVALALRHYTLTPADAAQAVDLLSGFASAVGGLIAIYGRVVATPKIGA
jgi:hypothetical protein